MKLFKILSGISFGLIALTSFNAHADILLNCTWEVTQVITIPGSPGGTVTVSQCKDGNVIAATRAVGSGNNICGLTPSTGYRVEGDCHTPKVFKITTPTSSSSSSSPFVCPMAGQVYGNVVVGMGQPAFPADLINRFCKADIYPWHCGYTAVAISTTASGATLKVTCITK